MDPTIANVILDLACDIIEDIIRHDVTVDQARWPIAIERITAQMEKVHNVVTNATHIPRLLIAVDHFWINQTRQWPDWQRICDNDITLIRDHPWLARVSDEAQTETVSGKSSQSVIGKQPGQDTVKLESESDMVAVQTLGELSRSGARLGMRKRGEVENAEVTLTERVKENEKGGADSSRRPIHRMDPGGWKVIKLIPHNSQPRNWPVMRTTNKIFLNARPRSETPDADWAYDPPCMECVTDNIDCYRPVTGTTCRSCKQQKKKCSNTRRKKLHSDPQLNADPLGCEPRRCNTPSMHSARSPTSPIIESGEHSLSSQSVQCLNGTMESGSPPPTIPTNPASHEPLFIPRQPSISSEGEAEPLQTVNLVSTVDLDAIRGELENLREMNSHLQRWHQESLQVASRIMKTSLEIQVDLVKLRLEWSATGLTSRIR
ncbi:hypothetical protein JVU11DRAFT_11128 [Chiua virens]|nr:hypothetical protein JVU11DRAFT_11128 [Chiua virens]